MGQKGKKGEKKIEYMNMKIWYLKTRENEIKYHIFYKEKRLQIKKIVI